MKTKRTYICGPGKDYYYGDPQPPQSAGYADFVEWEEAQFARRRRPKPRARPRVTAAVPEAPETEAKP